MKHCTLDDCIRPPHAKGLCGYHYRIEWLKSHPDRYPPPKRKYGQRPGSCQVEACSNLIKARGWCEKHYARWKRNGNPNVYKEKRKYEKPVTQYPEYRSWSAMKTRCYNPKDPRYERYGGRGITVCDRWRNSFANFYNDMGQKPTLKHTLDRVNNDKNYEFSNCQWATVRQQNANRSISSPVMGVNYVKRNKRWYAMLKINQKWVLYKGFETFDEALYARRQAENIWLKNSEQNHVVD